MSISYTELYEFVKGRLKPSRFEHSVGVAETAYAIAARFSLNAYAARYVGIYHDAYRYDADGSTAAMLLKSGMSLCKEEIENPMLLHGPLAAFMMRRNCGEDVPDPYLLAVRHHTLGSKDMGQLGAVLYIADYIEPGRRHLTADERRRIMDNETLEDMVLCIMDMQAAYFRSNGIRSAEVSDELYAFLIAGGRFQDLK